MKYLKNYNQFIFENLDIEMKEIFCKTMQDLDILESIIVETDALLKSIKAEEVDLYTTFKISPDSFKRHFTIDELYDNEEFNDQLNNLNFKKTALEATNESETFVDDDIIVKFFTILENDKSELEQPNYIIYQSKKLKDSTWNDVKCYKVNDNMNKFYNKLSNKTIELKKNDKTYIFNTSNAGSNWILQKHEDSQDNKIFKDDMSTDDIKAVLKDKNISITILA